MEVKMVLESAKPHLKNLAKVADRLNKASDKYTEEIKKIESDLNALRIGIEVMLPEAIRVSDNREDYDEGRDEVVGTYHLAWFIGYGKIGSGQWQILVFEYKQMLDGYRVYQETLVDTTPLLYASRDLRMESAEHLQKLLDLLHQRTEETIAKLEKVSDSHKA